MTWFRHIGDSKFHAGAPDRGSFCTLCNGRWPVEDERRGEVEHDENPPADERCTVCVIADLRARLVATEVERDRLSLLINTPRIDDFFEAVRVEAAHQVERWGVEHDAGKQPEDWVVLVVYLLGKATTAHFRGDTAKLLHHVITLGAVACNWHANMTGADTRMRPGLGDRVDADAQLAVARRALRAALGTWCPRDPGGDGADGETYRLCIEALEVRE